MYHEMIKFNQFSPNLDTHNNSVEALDHMKIQ